ncbi:MAG: prepilin peptidase [Myxococcota bacterium]
MNPLTFYGAFAFVTGLCVGSFLNVCIARMPDDRSIVSPPSHCPSCGSNIRPYDNIPVISWILLRGRCRDCGTHISTLYPTIELLTGVLAWLLFRNLFPTAASLDLAHGAAFVYYLGFVSALIALTFIDIRHFIIPDEFSIYAAPFAIGGMALLGWLGYPDAIGWKMSFLGAGIGGMILFTITMFWRVVRQYEGMGMGDVKLLTFIGAVVGPFPGVFFVMIVASLFGVIVGVPLGILSGRGWRYALPFGPFLAGASILWLLDGPALTEAYFPAAIFLSDVLFHEGGL